MSYMNPLHDRPSFYPPSQSEAGRLSEFNSSLCDQVQKTRQDLRQLLDDTRACPEEEAVTVEELPIEVFLRVKPLAGIDGESNNCISIADDGRHVLASNPTDDFTSKRYAFSHIFDPDTSQAEVYDTSGSKLVSRALGGHNSLLFTYGITGSGKTFTLTGSQTHPGILARAMTDLFSQVEGRLVPVHNVSHQPHRYCESAPIDPVDLHAKRDRLFDVINKSLNSTQRSTMSSVDSLNLSRHSTATDCGTGSVARTSSVSSLDSCDATDASALFSVFVEFTEVYNEKLYDLLVPLPSRQVRPQLKEVQDSKGMYYVKDLTQICVASAEEALKILEYGINNLKYASTRLNYSSSRRISFCDLAGSERTSRTQHSGDRQIEANYINKSLFTLGKCIRVLRQSQSQRRRLDPAHIPFRESKLTRLFQHFLTGHGLARMLVCVNQSAQAFNENRHVLDFAALAQEIFTTSSLTYIPPPAPKPVEPATPERPSAADLFPTLSPDFDNLATPVAPATVRRRSTLNDITTAVCSPRQTDSSEVRELKLAVEQLKQLLVAEKEKVFLTELRVRQELVELFQQDSDEQRDLYSDIANDQLVSVENYHNERLDLYSSLKNKPSPDSTAVTPEKAHLQEATKALQAELALCKTEIDSLRSQLLTSRDSAMSTDSLGGDPASVVKTMQKEKEELERMLTEAGETFKQHEKDKERMEAEIEQLKSQMNNEGKGGAQEDELRQRIAQLEAQLSNDENSHSELRVIELESRAFELEKERDAAVTSASQLRAELASARERHSVVEVELKQQEEKRKEIELSSGQWRTKVKNLEDQLTEEKKRAEEGKTKENNSTMLRRKAEEKLSQLEKANTDLSSQVSRLRDQELEYVQKVDSLQVTAGDAKREAETSKAEVEALQEKIQELQSAPDTADKGSDQTPEKAHRITGLESEVAQLNTRLQALEDEKTSLEKNNAQLSNQLKSESASISGVRNELAETQKSLRSSEAKIEDAKRQSNVAQSQLVQQQQQLQQQLQMTKQQYDQYYQQLQMQLAAKTDEVNKLKEELNMCKHNIDNMHRQLQENENSKSRLNNQMSAEAERLRNAQAQATTAEQRLAQLHKENEGLKIQISQVSSQIILHQKQCLELQSAYKTEQTKVRTLQGELEKAEAARTTPAAVPIPTSTAKSTSTDSHLDDVISAVAGGSPPKSAQKKSNAQPGVSVEELAAAKQEAEHRVRAEMMAQLEGEKNRHEQELAVQAKLQQEMQDRIIALETALDPSNAPPRNRRRTPGSSPSEEVEPETVDLSLTPDKPKPKPRRQAATTAKKGRKGRGRSKSPRGGRVSDPGKTETEDHAELAPGDVSTTEVSAAQLSNDNLEVQVEETPVKEDVAMEESVTEVSGNDDTPVPAPRGKKKGRRGSSGRGKKRKHATSPGRAAAKEASVDEPMTVEKPPKAPTSTSNRRVRKTPKPTTPSLSDVFFETPSTSNDMPPLSPSGRPDRRAKTSARDGIMIMVGHAFSTVFTSSSPGAAAGSAPEPSIHTTAKKRKRLVVPQEPEQQAPLVVDSTETETEPESAAASPKTKATSPRTKARAPSKRRASKAKQPVGEVEEQEEQNDIVASVTKDVADRRERATASLPVRRTTRAQARKGKR